MTKKKPKSLSELMSEPHHRRLRDFEAFDEIVLKTVPRYKTSGLSGDTWRTSVHVSFRFKGEQVHETTFSNMKWAIMMMGAEWVRAQEPIPARVCEMEDECCDQPGCPKKHASTYFLQKLYSDQGDELAPDKDELPYFRKFCKEHLKRGDASREDCDQNYAIQGPGPSESTNLVEHPSAFGGVVQVDGDGNLASAVGELRDKVRKQRKSK